MVVEKYMSGMTKTEIMRQFGISSSTLYNWKLKYKKLVRADYVPAAKAFLADTLGSGVRNLYKYSKIYCGGEPELEEGDVFRIFVPLKAKANGEANRYGLTERQQKILSLLRTNPTIKIDELAGKLETSESTINRDLSEMKKKVSINFNKKLQKWVIE